MDTIKKILKDFNPLIEKGLNTKCIVEDDSYVHLELHGARIITISPKDKVLILADGGYKTDLTKEKLNEALSALKIRRKLIKNGKKWYLVDSETGEKEVFTNHITLDYVK